MRAAAVLVLLALAAGCGGEDTPERPAPPTAPAPPRAAEPARSPATDETPAGRVIRIGPGPEGVAADGRTGLVAVALRDPPRLALLDGRTGRAARSVRLPAAARHLTLAQPGGPVLVPAEEADALVQVSLPEGRSETARVGDQPHDAAWLDGRAYVGDEFGSTLSEVAGARTTREAPVDVQPGGVVAVGDQIGVVSVRAYTFELFDPRTLRGLGSQSAGLGPTHGVVDADGRVYIADTRGEALIVFQTRPRLKWVGRLPLAGSPYGLAVDRAHGRVWVTLTGRNELVEVPVGDRPRRARTVPTVRQPNTVGVDERTGRVFVASRTDGTLQLIDP